MPKADKSAEPTDAELVTAARAALNDWLSAHIHNSPASRDTAAFNRISEHVLAIHRQLDQVPLS